MKGFLLAAGFGTRLKPITNDIPKPLVPFKENKLIDLNLKFLFDLNLSEIIINYHYQHKKMENYFDKLKQINSEKKFYFSYENEILGVGGGIGKIKKKLNNESLIIVNCDIVHNLNLEKIISFHKKNNNWATLALFNDKKYNTVLTNYNNDIIDFRNKNFEIGRTFCGISIIEPEIYEKLPENKFYNIITLYEKIMFDFPNKIKGFLYNDKNDYWYDIGNLESYYNVNYKFNNVSNNIYYNSLNNINVKNSILIDTIDFNKNIKNVIIYKNQVIYEKK